MTTIPSRSPMSGASSIDSALVLLQPDNFTPPSRTPWGGSKLINRYKTVALRDHQKPSSDVVGESWELSVGPEFPSAIESGVSLEQWLSSNPAALLGAEAAGGRRATALLVKWLDAADNLSVQIHPPDDYSGLNEGETGKSECWYVVDHEPGAGLYLGFRPEVSPREVRERLERAGDLSELLFFMEVGIGDLVVIEPGTPHAIGKGVTLIEPQFVTPGRRAVTYRYWDWNRRYDTQGKLKPVGGLSRELHLEEALMVTSWDRARSDTLLRDCVLKAGGPDLLAGAAIEPLCSGDAPPGLNSSRLMVARLVGDGPVILPDWKVLRALTVVEGEVRLFDGKSERVVGAGRTVAIGAALGYIQAHLNRAHALLSAVYVPT